MHLGLNRRAFCAPYRIMGALASRLKILMTYGSKKGTQIYYFNLKTPSDRNWSFSFFILHIVGDRMWYEAITILQLCHFEPPPPKLFQVSEEQLILHVSFLPAVPCLLIFGSFKAIIMGQLPTELPISVRPPSKREIVNAIKAMKNGKAAGADNIPAEVLKLDPYIYIGRYSAPINSSI